MNDLCTIDYAELNAPPMINYGTVYPQAILVFVITMLYSVIQPLILVFGTIYFGVAYVVYKYKLLFGEHDRGLVHQGIDSQYDLSVLQAVRVERASVADHIHPAHPGDPDFHTLHDRHFYPQKILHHRKSARTALGRHSALVMEYI